MVRASVGLAAAVALGIVGSVAQPAAGQARGAGASSGQDRGAAPAVRRSARPEAVTLARMSRRMTIDFQDATLEDIMAFFREFTGADIEVYWDGDGDGGGFGGGLEREQEITMSVRNMAALDALEEVLRRARLDFEGATWQMTPWGTMEVGAKSALNQRKRVVLYDINDLLFQIPTYDEVPQIDIQSILQQGGGGGGGGGQSPFDDDGEDEGDERPTRRELAEELIDLITGIVEPDQWVENGGDGGSIRYFQGSLIVNGPDYLHRQINGYPYAPATRVQQVGGRRWVSLNLDTGIGTVDGFATQPVTGVTPGGGGGGGGTPPPGGGG